MSRRVNSIVKDTPSPKIARQTQITPHTIRKFIRAETFPERSERTGDSSPLDIHKPYLLQRWQEGRPNAQTLWKELGERGYTGGYTIVKTHLRTLRQPRTSAEISTILSPAKTECSIREVISALLRPEAKRSDDEKTLLERLGCLWEPFRLFRISAEAFIALVRAPKDKDQSGALTDWIAEAQASTVCDLESFATGIKRDFAAVAAGLSLP